MTEPTPAAEEPVAPDAAARSASPGPAVRRRDWLLGGLAGLVAGGAAGGAVARALTRPEAAPIEGTFSYAQCGEDIILAWWMRVLEIANPTYLDIGVWEPIRSNNTYALSLNGGRGVLVEPNLALADKIRSARPKDTLLSVGVGLGEATEADYFMFNDSSLNTFDLEQRDRILKDPHFRLDRTVRVPLVNINRLMAEQFAGKAPDLLSIDVEGLELAILKSVDWTRFRPKVICTETLITLTRKQNRETTSYMADRGYEVRGMTYANSIFVDGNLLG